MATLYVGCRLFDGEKVQVGQAVLEEGGRKRGIVARDNRAAFAAAATRVAAE